MPKTRRHYKRKVKRTRRHRKLRRGGYNPVTNNTSYPTVLGGTYPNANNNWMLPDPKYIDYVTTDR